MEHFPALLVCAYLFGFWVINTKQYVNTYRSYSHDSHIVWKIFMSLAIAMGVFAVLMFGYYLAQNYIYVVDGFISFIQLIWHGMGFQ